MYAVSHLLVSDLVKNDNDPDGDSLIFETILNILESNNILLRFNDNLEFKHSYWIYYFAATYNPFLIYLHLHPNH